MEKKQFWLMISIMIGLSILLAIRLLFFLQDGTNDVVETVLIWLIYIGSVFTVVFYIYQIRMLNKNNLTKHTDKVIFAGAILLMEFLFNIKNEMILSRLYPISLLFVILIVISVGLLLPRKLTEVFDIFIVTFFFLYLIGQDVYYRIFHDLFSFKEAGTLREGLESSEGMFYFEVLYALLLIVYCLFLYF